MAAGSFRFDRFQLDADDRRLTRDGATVDLNARYLDALALLVREQGRLVSKERFLEEVWRGVPVTDEALTQCIRTIRRTLGDEAARPRFIETVPKHGYRFIAPVARVADEPAPSALPGAAPPTAPAAAWSGVFRFGWAGMVGGGAAGVFGGLFYGFASAVRPLNSDMGAASMVLVFMAITAALGMLGGGGIGVGIATARLAGRPGWWWSVGGGAAGGLIVGAAFRLIGGDAFNLLFGQSPGRITGAFEGAVLGAVIGLAVWLGRGPGGLRRGVLAGGLGTAAAGIAIVLLGGRMLGGSLDELARRFPGSRLHLDQLGALFGETGFGLVSQTITAGLEGLLFGAGVATALLLARSVRSAPARDWP